MVCLVQTFSSSDQGRHMQHKDSRSRRSSCIIFQVKLLVDWMQPQLPSDRQNCEVLLPQEQHNLTRAWYSCSVPVHLRSIGGSPLEVPNLWVARSMCERCSSGSSPPLFASRWPWTGGQCPSTRVRASTCRVAFLRSRFVVVWQGPWQPVASQGNVVREGLQF